jgi:hypothetical protein
MSCRCFDTGQVPGGACGVGDLPAATTVPLVLRCCCRDLTAGAALVTDHWAAGPTSCRQPPFFLSGIISPQIGQPAAGSGYIYG